MVLCFVQGLSGDVAPVGHGGDGPAAVLGGIGSVPGAMLGGYILGIAETMTKGFLLSQFADAISFSILIIILLVKPTGIMGEKVRVKV